jgi:hypothetical protein
MLDRLQRRLRSPRFRRRSTWALLGQWLLLNICLFGFVAFADDCARDLRRAEDCLRTPGFAQGISSLGGIIATILVNGVAIQTILLTPPPPEGAPPLAEGEEPPPPRRLNVQVIVQDEQQKQRTSFYADALDRLYIGAWVEEQTQFGTVTVAATVQFQLTSGQNWLRLDPMGASGQVQFACLSRQQPGPLPEDVPLPAPQVMVHTSLDGSPIAVPVALQVRRFRIALSGPPAAPPPADDGEP